MTDLEEITNFDKISFFQYYNKEGFNTYLLSLLAPDAAKARQYRQLELHVNFAFNKDETVTPATSAVYGAEIYPDSFKL